MNVQIPHVELNESRLLPDNYSQKNSDLSFAEKLQQEKARLGLLFSPFGQLQNILTSFSSNLFADLPASQPAAKEIDRPIKDPSATVSDQPGYQTNSAALHASAAHIDAAADTLPFSRQLMQELLATSNWLIPNLEAQPSLLQAFSQGTLAPSYDLQSLIDEIVKQASLVNLSGKTELNLTLKPAELGEVLLQFTAAAGTVAIQITASPETKKLIDSKKEELVQSLKKNGILYSQIIVKEVSKNA